MDRVWIRGKASRKVIDSTDVHYFYWKVETGLSHITLEVGGRNHKVPIFFLKANDYEPVKRSNGTCQSRFHHRFLTLFKKPRVINGRPVVDFLTKAHVPVVLSELPKRVFTDLDLQDLSFEETWSLPVLLQLLKRNCWREIGIGELNDYSVVSGSVPEGAVFDPAKLRLVVEISQ